MLGQFIRTVRLCMFSGRRRVLGIGQCWSQYSYAMLQKLPETVVDQLALWESYRR